MENRAEFELMLKDSMPNLSDYALNAFYTYYQMLTDWNERVNLTAITKPDEVIQKHFCDSITAADLIEQNSTCIDIGTGAGFPLVPLAIVRRDIKPVLLDSLNKRIVFLNELCRELKIDAEVIHARAEDAGHDKTLRGRFDVALTRAVAKTSVLLEWSVPFLKMGGKSIMYKGPSANDELSESKNAIKELGVTVSVVNYPVEWGERNIIVAKKVNETLAKYPRKPSVAKSKPL